MRSRHPAFIREEYFPNRSRVMRSVIMLGVPCSLSKLRRRLQFSFMARFMIGFHSDAFLNKEVCEHPAVIWHKRQRQIHFHVSPKGRSLSVTMQYTLMNANNSPWTHFEVRRFWRVAENGILHPKVLEFPMYPLPLCLWTFFFKAVGTREGH